MQRRTKWILGLLIGVPIAVLVLAAGIGLLLPQSHTASVSAQLDAPPDRVWTAITGVETFASWRPGIDGVERLADRDGLPVWRETGTYGAMTIAVTAWEAPHRLVTRIADEDLPFGGTWTYVLEPANGGTRLTITEDGEIYNPFFRFMARFVFGYEGTMHGYLEGLHRHLDG